MLRLTRDWYVALAVVAGGVLYSLPGTLHAQSSDVIRACVDKNGQTRLVTAGETCKKNEELVTWNIRGPQGPQGNVGPQGPAGRDGAPGLPGKDGRDGRDGVDGRMGLPGNVGPQGPPGIDGRDGAPGNVGPQGPPGKDGRDGAPGNVGPRGYTGDQGAPGQDGPAGPGTGVLIGLINPQQCGVEPIDARSLVAHVLNTNLFVPVEAQPGKKLPKGVRPYFPFQFFGVPQGRWTVEIGTYTAPVDADEFGNLTGYPGFRSMNVVANVLVAEGAITNVGTINLDGVCGGVPTEICGNGIDENGNGFVDENCPAIFDQVPPPPVCDDLGLLQCSDGTCRRGGQCPAVYVPPGNTSGNTSGGNVTPPKPFPGLF